MEGLLGGEPEPDFVIIGNRRCSSTLAIPLWRYPTRYSILLPAGWLTRMEHDDQWWK